MMKHITDDVLYVGVNDHEVDLFEGQYVVPNGVSYNSYVIADQRIAVMDTVDQHKADLWLSNVEEALGGRTPDYLVVQHMEPDHAGSIEAFVNKYPHVTVVGQCKTFVMMHQFFPNMNLEHTLEVLEGDTLSLGRHTLHFVYAPMVHWPEVIMTYDDADKLLFSADGFGKFGALDVEEDWTDEARRYFIGIVGKYGKQVQAVLKKAAGLDIAAICPLHGPVLSENLGYYLNLYDIWSSYRPEKEGICVCYTSVYGHTKAAVELLCEELKRSGAPWWSASIWHGTICPPPSAPPSAMTSWCWPPPPTMPMSTPSCGLSSTISPSAASRTAPLPSSRTALGRLRPTRS